MGILFALASAVAYGVSDTAGGLLSRRAHFLTVAVLGQLGALVLTGVAAPFLVRTPPGLVDLGWGALSGVGSGLGMLFLFRGMGRGAMTVVVPVSAVGGTALPVIAAVVLFGERPPFLTWLGVAAAIPALWLVSRSRGASPVGLGSTLDGLLAGCGIALQYVALARVGPTSGIWPVAAGRVTSTVVLLAVAWPMTRPFLRLPPHLLIGAAAAGAAAGAALVFYLVATREELVVVAVVLSSLYPVIPVLFGMTALRERVGRWQLVGLVTAAAAVVLIAVG